MNINLDKRNNDTITFPTAFKRMKGWEVFQECFYYNLFFLYQFIKSNIKTSSGQGSPGNNCWLQLWLTSAMNNSSLRKQLSEDNQTLWKLICSHLPQQYQLQYMNNVLNGVFLKKTTQNCITVKMWQSSSFCYTQWLHAQQAEIKVNELNT